MADVRWATDDGAPPPSPPAHRTSPIPHAELGASALFAAYVAGDPRALAFYAHDPFDPSARARAARAAADHPRDRAALADVLAGQNAAWGLPDGAAGDAVRAGIEALRDPASVAVVTGQQLGLFGGPLFTLHKALTTVRLAERLAAETGRAAVPVFWLADEDHDVAEVREAAFARDGEVVRVAYDDGRPPEANRGPVGRIVLGDEIERTFDALAGSLPPGPFAADLLAGLRAAWVPGACWRDAFARTLRLLLPEAPLVLVSADDPRLKALAAPVLRAEAEGWEATHAAHAARTAELEEAGFHVQVAPRPLHLFLLDGGLRLALDAEGDEAVVRASGRRLARADLVARAAGDPARLSPDVVLRPVVEDALLPTAAYVAGPGEAAYFAALGPVYARFGVPMPVVFPRASLTLVEPAVRRALERLGLDALDVRADPEGLHARLALAADGENLEAALAASEAAVEAAVGRAGAAAVALDPSLEAAAGAALARTRKALARLRRKAVRVAKRRHADAGAQLARAHAALFPGGKPQERALSALALYARYGPHLARLVGDAVDLDARAHLVVDLP